MLSYRPGLSQSGSFGARESRYLHHKKSRLNPRLFLWWREWDSVSVRFSVNGAQVCAPCKPDELNGVADMTFAAPKQKIPLCKLLRVLGLGFSFFMCNNNATMYSGILLELLISRICCADSESSRQC